MLNREPISDRADLGFREAVLSSFAYLRDFGLHPVTEQVTLVRYESSRVFVNVYHGRASFELSIEMGRLQEPDERLTLYDIVEWSNAETVEGFGQHVTFQVSSREGVQEFVPKLANLVQKYGAAFLKPDMNAYIAVHEARSRGVLEYKKQVKLMNVRENAEIAWRAKNYARVIELYRPVSEDLTEVETRRLAYARKQILSAEGVSPRSSNPIAGG
jgi:hypothetical protein